MHNRALLMILPDMDKAARTVATLSRVRDVKTRFNELAVEAPDWFWSKTDCDRAALRQSFDLLFRCHLHDRYLQFGKAVPGN